MRDAVGESVATKADIAELRNATKTDITELRADMYRLILSSSVVVIGLTVTLIKLLS